MPSHSLLSFVESPDAPAQDVLISNDASFPGFGSSMTPQTTNSEKAVGSPLSCMFCDLTFSHQAELGPHVLTQHPTTFSEPTVLRVEAEFRIPGERPRPKPSSPSHEKEEVHSCIVCGHVCEDAGELETHMRKHKDYFTYCCNVCGRRFREPWFLKNHMKMHGKPGAKNKALLDVEVPVTVNGVVQEPASDPVVTAYKLCMVCGFYFPDLHSLVEHSKVHNRDVEPSKDEEKMERLTSDSITNQETLLRGLNLRPRPAESILQHVRSSKWIPQLDPFNTYQAWQLATKGKVAVGPNITKDVGQDASTDNEDCNSDKEELNAVWSEGQGGDKTVKGGLGRELRSQHQSVTENPAQPQRRSLMQKPRDKERPTTCEECQRTFRTYHQLVLHSRVHKRERGGEESPTSSMEGKLSRGNSLEHAEDVPEDAFEDPALTENLNQGEDGSDRSRIRSKECSYCGKSFRSSYYLTVHLRTHTGEKPYKCAYCDYAAAQKTSLKYHLDRRHKNKPFVEIFCRAEPSAPSPTDVKQESEDGSPAQNPSKLWNPRATPEDKLSSDGQLSKHLLKMNDAESETLFAKSAHSQNGDVLIKCPLPLNMKLEREDIKEENSEAPLNLSLKVSFSVPVSAQPRSALTPVACPLCAYKTMYPEVLIMHHNLTHKDKWDNTKRTGMGAKQQRLTGCPPALQGKDVSPLPMRDRRHPRRTKSPPPPPSKLQEKTATDLPKGPKRPPPLHDTDSHSTQDSSSRFSDNLRKPSAGGKCAPVQPSPTDRVAIAAHRDVTWHSEAARLCLSRGFTTLPQMDFGEPSTKRQKYSAPTVREGDMGEKSGFRGPLVDGSSRLMKPTAQTSGPSTLPDTLVAAKNKPTAVRGGLDTEWTMMNLLHPYTPNDLASLYHRAPAPTPVPGGLSNSRAGGRTVLYQHLPTLPNLQRRDARGLFPNQWHGATDKRT